VARVFLLNPPSPEPVKTPLLSFCHLAASLRRGGHEVALLDASAPFAPTDHAIIAARIADFGPDLVGLHLKTLHVQPAYALAAELAARWTLVAGGPHPTVCPDEPFAHGFTYVVRGEGEETLVELADVVDGTRARESVAGLSFRGALNPRHNQAAASSSISTAGLAARGARSLRPAWYGSREPIPPAGLLSSRGCPAACTFCSNNVTGRRFRYRSAALIAAEVRELQKRFGMLAFTFLDDSLPSATGASASSAPSSAACGRSPTGPAPRTRRTSTLRPSRR
jgi:anaerobic magnesium-protoporphyrin IX monomethyl ester cyclase